MAAKIIFGRCISFKTAARLRNLRSFCSAACL